jgi:hypothetical protein
MDNLSSPPGYGGRYPTEEGAATKKYALIPPRQFGPISLGCSPASIYREFGYELTWEEWMGGNRNGDLYYHGLVFVFDACDAQEPLTDSKLKVVNGLAREDVVFRDRPLRSWTKTEIEQLLEVERLSFRQLIDGLEVEDWNFEFSFDENGNCDGFFMQCQ